MGNIIYERYLDVCLDGGFPSKSAMNSNKNDDDDDGNDDEHLQKKWPNTKQLQS